MVQNTSKLVRPGADISGTIVLSLLLTLIPMSWWATSVLSLVLAAFVVDLIFRPWSRPFRLGGRLVISVLAIAFIAYEMWPQISDKFDASYHLGKYAPPHRGKPEPLEADMMLDCQQMAVPISTVGSPTQFVWTPNPHDTRYGNHQAFIVAYPPPLAAGETQEWSADGVPLLALRCALSNFAPTPAYAIEIPVHYVFQNAAPQGNGVTAGSIFSDQHATARIASAGQNGTDPFVFYIVNQNAYWFRLERPQFATKARGESRARVTLLPPPVPYPLVLGPEPIASNKRIAPPTRKAAKTVSTPTISGDCSGNTVSGSHNKQKNDCSTRRVK